MKQSMESSISRKRVLITGGSGFIGTNVIAAIAGDYDVLNIDISPPRNSKQAEYWTQCDIRDGDPLTVAIRTFRPDFVLHLAARTDLDGQSLDDYSANVEGTQAILDSLQSAGFGGRAVFASS